VFSFNLQSPFITAQVSGHVSRTQQFRPRATLDALVNRARDRYSERQIQQQITSGCGRQSTVHSSCQRNTRRREHHSRFGIEERRGANNRNTRLGGTNASKYCSQNRLANARKIGAQCLATDSSRVSLTTRWRHGTLLDDWAWYSNFRSQFNHFT